MENFRRKKNHEAVVQLWNVNAVHFEPYLTLPDYYQGMIALNAVKRERQTLEWFERIKENGLVPDLGCYRAAIYAAWHLQDSSCASHLISECLAQDLILAEDVYLMVLRTCAFKDDYVSAKRIFLSLRDKNLLSQRTVGLLSMLAGAHKDLGSLKEMSSLSDSDVAGIAYRWLLRTLIQTEKTQHLESVTSRMTAQGISLHFNWFERLIDFSRAYCSLEQIQVVLKALATVLNPLLSPLTHKSPIGCRLLFLQLVATEKTRDALKLWDTFSIQFPNQRSVSDFHWAFFVLNKTKGYEPAIKVFLEMKSLGVAPDRLCYQLVIDAAKQANDLGRLKDLIKEQALLSLKPDQAKEKC